MIFLLTWSVGLLRYEHQKQHRKLSDCMNSNEIVAFDLAKVDVKIDSDDAKVMSVFPVDQEGKKMLDDMLLVSADEHTYVVPKPVRRIAPLKTSRKTMANRYKIDYLHGAFL